MEVLGGMLRLCGESFLKSADWRPDPCIAKPGAAKGNANSHANGNGHAKGKGHGAIDNGRLVHGPDYYPRQLADLARFALGEDD